MNHHPQQEPASAGAGQALPGLDSFLTLSADQLGAALAEATASLGGLTSHVLTLAGHAGAAPEAGRATAEALVGLQAVDRLQQRLGNVDRNLRALAALLHDTGRTPTDTEWRCFLDAVRRRYSTETERLEFDARVAGVPGREC